MASSWAKKHSAMIGSFVLGMLVQAKYWKQIGATLDAWGVPHGEWKTFLASVVAMAGIGMSVAATVAKNRKKPVAPVVPAQAGQGQVNP